MNYVPIWLTGYIYYVFDFVVFFIRPDSSTYMKRISFFIAVFGYTCVGSIKKCNF